MSKNILFPHDFHCGYPLIGNYLGDIVLTELDSEIPDPVTSGRLLLITNKSKLCTGGDTATDCSNYITLQLSSYQVIMTKGRVELGEITQHNIKQLKRLNQVVFPVTYNDRFYKDVLEVGELAKLAYYNDIVVGAVCCRIDQCENQRRLYIMTLGCLAPYRRLSIGTVMLKHVLDICEKDGNIDNAFLHVQVNNEGAIKFYEKHGFTIAEEKKNYYKRIEPADAYLLQKCFKETRGGSSSGSSIVPSSDGKLNQYFAAV